MLDISGMAARRRDGSIAGMGDVRVPSMPVCENLKTAVEAAEGSFSHVYRLGVLVRRRFPESLPASTLVEVPGLVAPGCLVEVNAIAVVEA